MKSDFTLHDGSKVAVIGGGPSGTLFSIFALKMARMVDKKIDLTIFEPKDFSKDGPAGCNHCGGVISEHLVQTLAIEGINIPPSVVQRGINSYVLHTQKGDVFIDSPSSEKRIATVYRGGGPKGTKEKGRESFDKFLLDCALKQGARHVPVRINGIKKNGKPVLMAKGEEIMEADLVVGAFGVNSTGSKIFEEMGIGYKKPETTSAFITELELGHDVVSEKFGCSIHFFLVPKPKNVKFAALIPKGRYVTLCILGKDIDEQTVATLLATQAAKELLPDNVLGGKHCKCFPKLTVSTAEVGYSDRVIMLGDAGSTRLFKDGIGASYVMAKAAASAAVFHGVSKELLNEHYKPTYNRTKIDNMYGRFVYATTNTYKNLPPLTEALVNVVRKEQENKGREFPRLSSMLWDTFTGNETYKNIFIRGTNIWMHIRLILEFLKAIVRRGK